MSKLAPCLNAHDKLDPRRRCTHKASIVHLKTGSASPIFRNQYPVPRSLNPVVQQQVDEWLALGVIIPCPHGCPWNSPLLVVRKKDAKGEWSKYRICIDPRPINTLLPDCDLALPTFSELFRRLEGFAIASALDLASSFTQFTIAKMDRIKTAFTWGGIRYMFVGAPFGLKPLTSIFQSAMEQILQGCEEFVLIFVDDIFIFSKRVCDHAAHVERVISLLTANNLRLQLPKCKFGYLRVRLLGHLVSGAGRSLDPAKLTVLADYPKPTTGKQIMAYLGFVNYLRDYIPLYASIAAPLERLRHLTDIRNAWTQDCDASFAAFRSILSEAPVLHFPTDGIPFVVAVDASQRALGAVLFQRVQGRIHYIAFVSKALSKGQLNYSATKRELCAIVFALQRFRQYIYGTHFELQTDHKALTFLFTQKHLNHMILSWLDVLLDYSFRIVHCPGVLNVLADSLSRLYPDAVWNGGDISSYISGDTINAPSTAFSKPSPKTSGLLSAVRADKPVRARAGYLAELVSYPEKELSKFITDRFAKTLPPMAARIPLLSRFHNEGHFGSEMLFKSLWTAGYFWPGMRAAARAHIGSCVQCLRYNIGRSGFHPMRSIIAQSPMDHGAIDLAGPYPTTPRGYNFILVFTDVASRMVFLRPLRSKSAADVAAALWHLFCDIGFPLVLQSDNGTEFVNSVIQAFSTLAGVDRRLVAPYNPRADGIVEIHVRTTKSTLYKMMHGNICDFDLLLPHVQFAMNKQSGARTKSCAFALFYPGRSVPNLGDSSTIPIRTHDPSALLDWGKKMTDIVYPAVQANARAYTDKYSAASDKKRSLVSITSFPIGSSVMIKDPVRSRKYEPRYVGPYSVVAITRAKTLRLLDSTGVLLSRPVPVDQVKLISLPHKPDTDIL